MATQFITNTLRCPAPAKLNLFLHIVGRRSDGYHNLQTVFQLLDYCDELTFQYRDDGQIHLHDASSEIPPAQNLIMRAAHLLQKIMPTSLGADIYLDKKIPIGGGLGGGSSNAATTLLALNHLWQLHLPLTRLAELGLALGADIPVFIHGHSAWAEGVGEKLQAVDLPESWFVVLIPPCQISSAEFFSHPQLTRDTPPITISRFLQGHGHNDFEALARKLYPEVATALDWLSHYAPARLTGSGSCVFATVADELSAKQIIEQIPSGFRGFIAKAVNHSPLHAVFGVSPSGKARGFDLRIPRFES